MRRSACLCGRTLTKPPLPRPLSDVPGVPPRLDHGLEPRTQPRLVAVTSRWLALSHPAAVAPVQARREARLAAAWYSRPEAGRALRHATPDPRFKARSIRLPP